ncbi:MAG: polysaccharide biosynthesis/export family protein [Acidobacteriaceae bacterium]|nr:polysaccharide biosynthesis/export family protein [Acidobacteriaceae bacterium]
MMANFLRLRIGIGAVLMIAVVPSLPAQDRQGIAAEAVNTPQGAPTDEHRQESSARPNAGPALLQRGPRYQLSAADVLDISFPFTPEFNQSVTIQPDGYITLTDVGDLQVSGKTVPELTELLRAAYAKILHDPVINIVLKDFQKPYFIASGELAHPGKYDLRSDTTLSEAVAIAGGFTENSKHSEVYLYRHVPNGWAEVRKVDVKKMFKDADLSEDLHLQPGDMVFVPQNRISKFRRYIPAPGVGVNMAPY